MMEIDFYTRNSHYRVNLDEQTIERLDRNPFPPRKVARGLDVLSTGPDVPEVGLCYFAVWAKADGEGRPVVTTPPPTIDIYLTPQPYGLGAGEPVFELVFNGVPGSYEAAQRVRQTLALLQNAARGVTGVWISSAPWGAAGLDEALFQILGDETVRSVRATLPAVGAPGSQLSLGWIADASKQMWTARSAADLQYELTQQLTIPLCTDLVVMTPARDNLSPAHLDALMSFASIGGQVAGSLVVEPDDVELAMYAAAKASGSWRVQPIAARPRVHLKTETCV